jgi:hypothetical protein
MERRYSIARNENGTWIVSADGQEMFACASESEALKAAQDAEDLLNQPATPPIRRSRPERTTINRAPRGRRPHHHRRP